MSSKPLRSLRLAAAAVPLLLIAATASARDLNAELQELNNPQSATTGAAPAGSANQPQGMVGRRPLHPSEPSAANGGNTGSHPVRDIDSSLRECPNC